MSGSAWVLVAAVASAGAVALLVPGPAVRRVDSSGPGVRGAPVVACVVAAGLLAGRHEPRLVAWGLLLLAGAYAVSRLLRARRRDREALATAASVAEACQVLAVELRAGVPPGRALERVAVTWPPCAGVAGAHRVGSDVPGAWRALAERPGAAGLRRVAAAWQVSARTGQGLAAAVDRVAGELRRDRETRRTVEGELASARSTARLVAALPVFALLLGSGGGADPVGFLLGTPAGLSCLAAGLGLGAAGLAWIERLARDVVRDAS